MILTWEGAGDEGRHQGGNGDLQKPGNEEGPCMTHDCGDQARRQDLCLSLHTATALLSALLHASVYWCGMEEGIPAQPTQSRAEVKYRALIWGLKIQNYHGVWDPISRYQPNGIEGRISKSSLRTRVHGGPKEGAMQTSANGRTDRQAWHSHTTKQYSVFLSELLSYAGGSPAPTFRRVLRWRREE